MATPKFAWGIDIGNRALKAIRLARDGDSLRIDDIEVIEHEQVLSNSGDNKESLIQSALANFAQRHPTKGGIVAVGVSGQASFARFIKLPPVEEKKIPEIVKFEAIQQIPFPLEDVEWDYQLFRQADSPDVEVGIFAMRKELVNHHIKYFTDMDMNVQLVQTNPLAVYNAMFYDNRLQDGTTMILDLGAENADLIIADGESVWLRTVPIGGNNFTEALVKAFKLNFTKAEELKRNAQTSKYARQIFQAMRPIFADLVAEIQRSIGFYSSIHRDSRIKKIIALGNTFRLPTLQKYLQQNLQIDVERLDAFQGGAPDDGRLAAVLNENIASLAGAYGLALQAMGQGKIESSLLPREIQQAKVWQEKTPWFATAAAICLIAAGAKFGAYYMHNQKYEANGEARQTVDSTLRKAKELDRQWQTIESSGGPEKQRIINVNSLRNYRDMWADLWLDLTRAIPAQTGEAPAKLKATPRDKRQQVFIESFASQYNADMSAILAMSDNEFKGLEFVPATPPDLSGAPGTTVGAETPRGLNPEVPRGLGGGGNYRPTPRTEEGGGDSGEPKPAGPRGYLLTIKCTSPTANASDLVHAALIDKLKTDLSLDNALKNRKHYYYARGLIVSAQQIRSDPARQAKILADFTARQNMEQKNTDSDIRSPGGAGGGQGRTLPGRPGAFNPERPPLGLGEGIRPTAGPDAEAAQKELEKKAFAAPNFPDESILDDWELTVLVAIVLDPKAPEAPPADNTDQQQPPPPSEVNTESQPQPTVSR